MTNKTKPSLWWIALAPIVFVLGTGGGTALIFWRVIGLHEGESFLVPSTQEFQIVEPGTYMLWHDNRITFEGTVYNKPESLPDQAKIALKHDGEEVSMRASWGSGVKSGTHEKKEIARYEIDTPGDYTLCVEGFSENRVFSFGRSGVKGLLFAALACLLLNLLGWFGPPAIVVFVLVMRARNQKELANHPTQPTPQGSEVGR